MNLFDRIIRNLPEVAGPTQKRLGFREKLKWTGIVLVTFYVLGQIPLYGLGENALSQFQYLSTILGANFGSITSLGVGPIVTASIVLQLLNGSGILPFDMQTSQGKQRFQGAQKLLAIFFVIFEAFIYVFMGGLAPSNELAGTGVFMELQLILVFQLVLGGLMILFMDEVVSKWGFGSGIGLFIAAGVSQTLFVRAFNPLASPSNPNIAAGAIPAMIQALSSGNPVTAGLKLTALISTVIIFIMCVYGQSMRIEIPLSFGRIRGHGVRWPLKFFYTNVIPIILVAALLANIQLWARLLQEWVGHPTFLGGFSGNQPVSGLAAWVNAPNIVGDIIKGSAQLADFGQALVYLVIMMGGATVFSVFWAQTSGMDARSQAKQIMSSGLQIPGFRKDQRVLERLLDRYVPQLTVMSGLSVGLLAAVADLSGALGQGTGILLAVMIIYQLYEEISKQHMMDMNPMMRKFME